MTKLQQLKAYQPPKLDYLVQMKIDVQARANLISADAMNLSHNPRIKLNYRIEALILLQMNSNICIGSL